MYIYAINALIYMFIMIYICNHAFLHFMSSVRMHVFWYKYSIKLFDYAYAHCSHCMMCAFSIKIFPQKFQLVSFFSEFCKKKEPNGIYKFVSRVYPNIAQVQKEIALESSYDIEVGLNMWPVLYFHYVVAPIINHKDKRNQF